MRRVLKMTKKTTENGLNPFVFDEAKGTAGNTAKLELTPVLINTSNARAVELMRTVGQKPELFDLANTALDRGETTDVIALIEAVFDEETLKKDSEILKGADEDQLSRLLESRRSDRSKAKAKGPRSNVAVCQTFLGSMYAEMLVRLAWNKPYQPTATEVNYDELKEDQDALNRKIKSLQSKKCRLGKTAPFVDEDAKQLEEVENEIERLKSLRVGSNRVSTTKVIKSASVDEIRKALDLIDINELKPEQQEKIEKLMAQLK